MQNRFIGQVYLCGFPNCAETKNLIPENFSTKVLFI